METKSFSSRGSGALSPRWIQQLLDSNFSGSASIINPEVVTASHLRSRVGEVRHHRHVLTLVANQSSRDHYPPPSVLHAVCSYCDYHFIAKTFAETLNGMCQQPRDPSSITEDSRPLHHLVWVASASPLEIAAHRTKYYPLVAQAFFRCSACPFQVTVEISEPRLTLDERRLFEDTDRVRRNIQEAKEKNPVRYQSADNTWLNKATSTIMTYIEDVLVGGASPISQHNKTFAAVLGPESYPILAKLGFVEGHQLKDGIQVPVFFPPALAPVAGDVINYGSERAFLEDFRVEVQNIVYRTKEWESSPVYVYPILEALLGCQSFHRHPSEQNTSIYPTLLSWGKAGNPEPPEFATLGAMHVFCQEYVLYAYRRQCAVLDKSHWPLLARSLGSIASNSIAFLGLSEAAAIEASLLEFDQPKLRIISPDVRHAMETLSVNDPVHADEKAIISAFYKKVMETPAQIDFLRSMLVTISSDRNMELPDLSSLGNAILPEHVALEVLRLNPQAEPDSIAERANSMVLENPGKEALHRVIRESLVALSHYHYNDRLAALAERLGPPKPTDTEHCEMRFPVGLANIGNTCYLNSILQLLYSCKSIRDVATAYESNRSNLNDHFISSRRIGANGMPLDRAEGVVAQFFVKELSDLFFHLHKSKDVAVKPSQMLANSALISTSHLLGGLDKEVTRPLPDLGPLPARLIPPSFRNEDLEPPAHNGSRSVDQQLPLIKAANASVETLVDVSEAGSNAGAETRPFAIGQQVNDAHLPFDLASPRVGPPGTALVDMTLAEIKDRLEVCLGQQERSSGTDQQDFEEVHGRILNLIQASLMPSRTVDNIQWDCVMDTFYVTVANYTKSSEGLLNAEVVSDRYVTAYPAESGACSLYEALDRNFDRQGIEGSKTLRWSSIRQPAPILNVLIQRTQGGGSKNRNQVTIPETLDLSRYMDYQSSSTASSRNFDLLPVRFRAWHINSRIESLQALKAGDSGLTADELQEYVSPHPSDAPEPLNEFVIIPPSTALTDFLDPDDFAHEGLPQEQVTALVGPSDSEPRKTAMQAAPLGGTSASIFLEIDLDGLDSQIDQEVSQLRQLKEEMLASASVTESFDSKDVIYHLHAIICHSGGLQAGHYWVWIKDHEGGIWRKYNDSHITETTNTVEVLGNLGGDPYYLCYVRAHDRAEHVDSPIRPWAQPVEQQLQTNPTNQLDEVRNHGGGTSSRDGGAMGLEPLEPVIWTPP